MIHGVVPKPDYPTSSWPKDADSAGTEEYTLLSRTGVLGVSLWEQLRSRGRAHGTDR